VDLCLREGVNLEEAVSQARQSAAQQEEAGVNIEALESAARTALANGAFEDGEEEIPAIVEEFYPESVPGQGEKGAGAATGNEAKSEVVAATTKLGDKLGAKASRSLAC
jgi:hypothetical protein